MLSFSVIPLEVENHHFIMAEGRNFETLVQNEGLDPIGEIQTRILYIYTYKHFSYRMNIHLPAIWKFRPGVEGFDGF